MVPLIPGGSCIWQYKNGHIGYGQSIRLKLQLHAHTMNPGTFLVRFISNFTSTNYSRQKPELLPPVLPLHELLTESWNHSCLCCNTIQFGVGPQAELSLLPAYCCSLTLPHTLALMMEMLCFSDTWGSLQTMQCYNPGDHTLHRRVI